MDRGIGYGDSKMYRRSWEIVCAGWLNGLADWRWSVNCEARITQSSATGESLLLDALPCHALLCHAMPCCWIIVKRIFVWMFLSSVSRSPSFTSYSVCHILLVTYCTYRCLLRALSLSLSLCALCVLILNPVRSVENFHINFTFSRIKFDSKERRIKKSEIHERREIHSALDRKHKCRFFCVVVVLILRPKSSWAR